MAGATNPYGYPYPSPADAIADLAAKVQELAQYIDDNVGMVKVGQETFNAVTINTDYSSAVVFASAFPVGTVPRVQATISNRNNPASYEPVLVTGVTRTGFTITVRRSAASASITVDWTAIAQ